ncbi:helix-turn-helix domain-containing protein [Streptomyces sp. NPDC046985]|uniref:helix-turn-helix domain-containing protein n=1 Tax=Streptomyces sp. NPDC046985 TaxID=3155377 RepID=UPI0034093690
MTVRSAVPVSLRACARHRLKKSAYGHKTPHQLRCRAEVVLAAARGHSNARIARDTGLHLDTVRTWRGRFASGGLPALADRKRSGRPPLFAPVQTAEVKALACRLPAGSEVPLARRSCPELARAAVERGITGTVSASTVRLRMRPPRPTRPDAGAEAQAPGSGRQDPGVRTRTRQRVRQRRRSPA